MPARETINAAPRGIEPAIGSTIEPTPAFAALVAAITRGAGGRPWPSRIQKMRRVQQLAESGAWIEAALAVLDLDLAAWHLRRIAYDGGQWICTLSRRPDLPIAVDDVAEARHTELPQAILDAIREAHRLEGTGHGRPTSIPPVLGASRALVACDNFA